MRGGVFISYRREDSHAWAGRIYDRLSNRLGHDNVFFDVDNIAPGLDFVEVLSERVGNCDALVAVIGKDWLSSANRNGARRLEDPNDFVRIEIEAALARDIRVIPVLVEDATMPTTDELPESLKKLARRQGIEISHTRFDSDVERLNRALSLIEAGLREQAEPSGGGSSSKRPDEAHEAPEERVNSARLIDLTPNGSRVPVGAGGADGVSVAPVHLTGHRFKPVLAAAAAAVILLAGALLLAQALMRSGHGSTTAPHPAQTSSLSSHASTSPRTKEEPPLEKTATGGEAQSKPTPDPDQLARTGQMTQSPANAGTTSDVAAPKALAAAQPAPNPAPSSDFSELLLTNCQSDVDVLQVSNLSANVDNAIADCHLALKARPTNPQVQYQLALALNSKGSYAEANSLLRQSAESGFAPAQTALGEQYQAGNGVKQDYLQAMAWYSKAADQGYPEAQLNISGLYAAGLGVKKNLSKAIEWQQKAQEQTNKSLNQWDEEAKAAANRVKKN
jgi:TIR domain/Sel1 repeat